MAQKIKRKPSLKSTNLQEHFKLACFAIALPLTTLLIVWAAMSGSTAQPSSNTTASKSIEQDLDPRCAIQDDESNASSTVSAVCQKLKDTDSILNLATYGDDEAKVTWISGGYSVMAPANSLWIEFTAPSDLSQNLATNPTMTALQDSVRDTLLNSGYRPNNENTSETIKDETLYDYVQGYANEDSVCLSSSMSAVTNSAIDASDPDKMTMRYVFSCAPTDTVADELDFALPYLKAANFRNTNNSLVDQKMINAHMSSFNVVARSGTGSLAYFYNDDAGDPKLIRVGHDVPACSEFEAKDVPIAYWLDCYQADGTLRRTN